MNRLFAGAIALAFVAASPAYAEKHELHGGMGHSSAAHMAPSHGGGMREFPARPMGGMARERPAIHEHRSASVHGRMSAHHHAATSAHRAGRHATTVRHAAAHVRNLHRVVHARHRFHAGAYRRPHGWYAHHWRLGERLPRAWFVRDYWIVDWGLYGLFAPPDGLVWVRVGPDALLIDPYTGEIVAIYYGVFW
jgi:Ni/Co efflux regulator RcnB